MTTNLTPPLKWHGGKHYLAKRIVALMPPHLHYVEPYFGGGSVLLARDPDRDWLIDDARKLKHGDKVPAGLRGCSEVVNDIDGELMNFWDCLKHRGAFKHMVYALSVTPFSQYEFSDAMRILRTKHPEPEFTPVDRAMAFFVCCRQSLAGRMKDFAPLSKTRTRRGMNEQASAWLSAIEGLPAVHERLKGVAILNKDALDVIRQQDGGKTLFYFDPPYLKETRTAKEVYRHEMTLWEHRQLCELLARIEGKFLLSGYRHELYDNFSEKHGWHRVDFDLPNNAAGGDKKRRMIECVWMNYEAPTTEDAEAD